MTLICVSKYILWWSDGTEKKVKKNGGKEKKQHLQ